MVLIVSLKIELFPELVDSVSQTENEEENMFKEKVGTRQLGKDPNIHENPTY